jgi:hypothetical protein
LSFNRALAASIGRAPSRDARASASLRLSLAAPYLAHPADQAVEEIVGTPTVSMASAVTPSTEHAEVALKLVAVAFVGQVVDVEVRGRAAVFAAACCACESGSPTRLPFRAAEVCPMPSFPGRPLPLFDDREREQKRAKRPHPPRKVNRYRLRRHRGLNH